MITVSEAERLINSQALVLESEEIPLNEVTGRVLMEEISADRDFPPFNRVTMDGIAIRFDDLKQGGNHFQIIGVQAAGSPPLTINEVNQAIEVMTGGVLPQGADTIIPYEHISINGNEKKLASLNVAPTKGQNIHTKGSDRLKGATIIWPDTVLGSPEIGVAATVGKSMVRVIKPPSVAIIATGDELVAIDQIPLTHQIRSSNAATLAGALQRWKIEADLFHIVDDLAGTTEKLKDLIQTYKILILSGGVSKGKFDFVPTALEQLGVIKHFHKIRQRPGKPFWFGSHKSGSMIFAFPGNPVSSFMCFNRYLKPWLDKLFQQNHLPPLAILAEDVQFKPNLTYFAQVKIFFEHGKIMAKPIEGHGSGDLANLVDADGFLELPRGKNLFSKGDAYPFFGYRVL